MLIEQDTERRKATDDSDNDPAVGYNLLPCFRPA
jgi:hypothetical protein